MSGSAALDPRFEASGTLSGTASVREDSKAASLQFPDLLSFEGGKAAAASAAPAAGGASGGESGGAKGKGKAASKGKGKKPAASGAGADEDDREAERKRKREEAAARKAERGRKAEAAAKKKKDEEAAKKKKVVEVKFDEVPAGQKKKIEGTPMLDAYHPKAVEHSWDAWWQEQGYYSCDPEEAAAVGEEGRFVMVIPPPNVTGSLHLGHALTCAVEDTLARWHRMRGKKVMWLPGTDHAGIATQAVVERMLKRDEGKTRQDLGREKFLEKVWEWKEQYGGRICSQLRSLGVSVDWSRERFTMDAGLSKAVNACFVTLFERGLIYRQSRLVNWCCALNTAISDIEVDYMDVEKPLKRAVPGHDPKKKYEFGWLTNFAYKLEKPVAGLEELVVATTRLETMLGDVAVAVHPEDPRYKAIHGASLVHPFTGRKIPVITDGELVDMSFGTGAVKITPAHDPNDFACGLRHGLPEIVVLSDDGRMNEQAGIFKGQMRFDARINVAKELEKLGLLRGKEPNKMRIGVCSRSGDIIEPLPKPQWWMACKDMAAKAAKSVRDGELKIVPKMHESTWFHWLDNCQDWCISRQLWWGHRIPAYFVTVEGQPRAPDSSLDHWVVAKSDEEAKAKAAAKLGVDASKITLEQDEDVLDTWFSSGLFPFSTFGWPDEDHLDYNGFYPNTLLETGHDILFFWVARMVMMGMELTGKLPFRTVYLHAMVRDKYGRKMSKSLGNVIDPMEVIDGCSLEHLHDKLSKGNLPPSEVKKAQQGQSKEYPYGIPECGADALRFGLLAYTKQGRDINLDTNRVVAYRHFCNKLWNATKLLLSYLPEGYQVPMSIGEMEAYFASPDGRGSLAVRDRWILSRLHHAVTAANTGLDKFHFAEACEAMHGFWLHDLCDVYLELTKAVVRGEDAAAKDQTLMVLMYCYETGLRMLHPVMPFVTEELWHRMPTRGTDWSEGIPDPPSVMVAPYPMPIEGTADPHAERMVDACMRAVKAARVIRSKVNLKAKQKTELFIRCEAEAGADFSAMAEDICQLGGGTSVAIIEPGAAAPGGCLPEVVDASATLLSKVQGAVDAKAEAARMQKQMDKKVKALAKQEKKMATEKYKTKTPTEIQEKDAGAVNEQKLEIARIQESIEQMLALA